MIKFALIFLLLGGCSRSTDMCDNGKVHRCGKWTVETSAEYPAGFITELGSVWMRRSCTNCGGIQRGAFK